VEKRMTDTLIHDLIDISQSPAALMAQADLMLERAKWAADEFQRYDRARTYAIAEAVAREAHAKAGSYAEWAVRETGFGVAEHKKLKNELTSLPFVEYYRDWDFVTPHCDPAKRVVEIPRPAGVIFALIPSTNPISTLNFKILCALLTRNSIVMSPHPAARECCVDAARHLAAAAEQAGAPNGVVQVVEQPTIPLIEVFMRSEKTAVILATGGTAMVRSAYSSSNPAIGVGPGNAPVFVDSTADIGSAAKQIADSKSFDNSLLCTNESVLIVTPDRVKELGRELQRCGCHLCSPEEVEAIRAYLFHERGFNVEAVGRDATWIAEQAAFKVSAKVRVLITPIESIGLDEPLSKEKLCPVLAMFVASSRSQALDMARAVLRLSGAGHSAAIHCGDPQTILDFAARVEAYRVVVNAPCSQGAAGFGTDLPPSFTIGTGYFGRSSIGENIGPQHLVHWTRIALHEDAVDLMAGFPRALLSQPGPLPRAPSDGVPGMGAVKPDWRGVRPSADEIPAGLREQIRRIIAEELRQAFRK
jgi:acyl-CoA reductase-like NAD-dependent aldehyde dehydrogenase